MLKRRLEQLSMVPIKIDDVVTIYGLACSSIATFSFATVRIPDYRVAHVGQELHNLTVPVIVLIRHTITFDWIDL